MKHVCDLLKLSLRFLRTEVNRGADARASHIKSLFHVRKQNLVVAVRIRQKLVVIELEQEWNLVSVLPCHRSEHTKRCCHCVATALDRQLHNVFGIEIERIRRE